MISQPVAQLITLGFVIVGAVALALYAIRYRKNPPETREFPVFSTLSDEVGRVAEEGASIHIALGKGSLISEDAMTSVAALQSLRALLDLSAAYDTPPTITTGDATLYVLANDWMRRAYARIGNAKLYRPNFVQFVAPTPVTYAAMATTQLLDGGIGSNIILGVIDQEASLLIEGAGRRNVHSLGGTTSLPGLGALYPALAPEHLVMGEEIFAGGAEVIQRPPYWASLWAQDILRWLVIAGIGLTVVFSLFSGGG